MEATPFARSIEPTVRESLEKLQLIAGTRPHFDPATAEREFTIIASDYVFLVLLTRVGQILEKRAPRVRLRVILTNEQTDDMMRLGQADFAILPVQRSLQDHPRQELFTDDFSCLVCRDNPDIGRELSMQHYIAGQHVSTSLGPGNLRHIESETMEVHHIERHIALYAPTFTLAAHAVVGTRYIATLHSLAARALALQIPVRLLRPPMQIPPFTEVLQWHKNRSADAGSRWMRAFLVDCATQLAKAA
jgi:DNA-binding transcriptional LysR family regulator